MRNGMCVILVLCLIVSGLGISGTVDSKDVTPKTAALTPHAPIRIDSNADFPGIATAGNGTVWAPWVIENWDIDANGSEYSIYVGNTTEYFSIVNCNVHNASAVYKNPPQNASILCLNVTNGRLSNNTIFSSANGIVLFNSSCDIAQNNISGNADCGIQIINAFNSTIFNNTIYNNTLGLNVTDSIGYSIYNNNFMNNTLQANDPMGMEYWDSGYPGGGNYWSDYSGTDNFNGPSQNWIGGDGIGDTWYPIGAVIHDRYPLMMLNMGQTFGESVLPYATSWGPVNDSVPVQSPIYIQWNESMNWTLVDLGFGYTDGTNVWNSSNGSWNHDTLTFNSTFTPAQQFEYNMTYWVTMSCNVTDYIGNYLDQNMSGTGGEWPNDVLTWNFTTMMQDITPPFALNHSPNGTDIPMDAPITITWNETMNWTSVEGAFNYTDGINNYSSVNGTWLHSSTTNISTFTPTNDFAWETQYFVTINCTATDIIGNRLDQDGNGTGGCWPADMLQWNFTVTDEAPYVVSTMPANAQVDVDPFKPIKIIFSERMNRTSVENAFSYTNGTQTWDMTDGIGYWNVLQTEFSFSPVLPLPLNQTLTAMLNGTLARDVGGKSLVSGNYTWSFKTWLEPPAPHVIDTYPPGGATNVNVNTYINIVFDSEMDIVTSEAAFSYTDGLNVWSAVNGTVDWFSENSLLSFQPAEKLRFDSTYTVRISSNATSIYGERLDGNDNGIPDASDDYVFTFTTTPEPPIVSSFYPGAGQMNVPVTLPAIYINFSKPMDATSVTNAVSIYPNTAFTPAFYAAGMNLTLVLAGELLEATQYRVTVLGTATDMNGIKLDGNNDGWAGDKFTFSFYTVGIEQPIKPEIISIFPTNNATIPIEGFYISVTFNVAMNRTSVQGAFLFKNDTQDINGTFSWRSDGKNFRFTPAEVLSYNMTYHASIAGSAKDVSGLVLGNATNWEYVTETEQVPASLGDWIIYGVIIFLVLMVIVLYMANRSLRKDLKRTRVKLKKLKRQIGQDENIDKDDSTQKEDEVPDESPSPVEESPEEIMPDEAAQEIVE
ncbi:MAG: Ig-like domain-containing protein [Thermoplasmata archaeon]|nr:Ig-like domain-containing protein [Thermoplasmata archaeon]